jgi:hypothetical protein
MPIPVNVFNDAVRGFWNQRIAQLGRDTIMQLVS